MLFAVERISICWDVRESLSYRILLDELWKIFTAILVGGGLVFF